MEKCSPQTSGNQEGHREAGRPQRSITQSYLTIFCWIFPGLALIGLPSLFGLRGVSSVLGNELIGVVLVVLGLAGLILPGLFASMLRITHREGASAVNPRSLARETFYFVLWQLLLAPTVAFGAVILLAFLFFHVD